MEKPRKGLNIGRIPTFEDSFKIAVAREYISGDFSYRQVGNKYDLSGDTVRHFVYWYRKHYCSGSNELSSVPESSSTANEGLVKELALARLKITAMEMLISNFEKETGVDILKKYGTKQSNK
ncbi:transposase [Pedobacter sp. MR2016-24]|uniref:transposase n=1 Tax=Pedobacter sp. MR2016-24 TaxID=2994466 RepID=UPI002246436C|nr:transposase [Pedobacter sp. MR2016-24]MCX2486796.1 transposase [Pedobacter sp. MR2016-24]